MKYTNSEEAIVLFFFVKGQVFLMSLLGIYSWAKHGGRGKGGVIPHVQGNTTSGSPITRMMSQICPLNLISEGG